MHLGWIEPLEDTAQRLEDHRHQYQAAGRTPFFGLLIEGIDMLSNGSTFVEISDIISAWRSVISFRGRLSQ